MIKPRLMKFNEILEDEDVNIDIIESKKKFNSIIKKSKDNAKLEKCYYCGKENNKFLQFPYNPSILPKKYNCRWDVVYNKCNYKKSFV